MESTEFIWMNGTFVPWNEAKVHVLSHSLHYGGGAFEGIRVYKTAQGPGGISSTGAHAAATLFSWRAQHGHPLFR